MNITCQTEAPGGAVPADGARAAPHSPPRPSGTYGFFPATQILTADDRKDIYLLLDFFSVNTSWLNRLVISLKRNINSLSKSDFMPPAL